MLTRIHAFGCFFLIGALLACPWARAESKIQDKQAEIVFEKADDKPQPIIRTWMDDESLVQSAVPLDPFSEIEKIQKKMNKILRDSFGRPVGTPESGAGFGSFEPAADLDETQSHYWIRIDIPGMTKENISVEIVRNSLVVSGERKYETEQKTETSEGRFFKRERRVGTFSRTIPLPDNIKQDEISATYENGVLTVRLTKLVPAGPSPKTVKISVQ